MADYTFSRTLDADLATAEARTRAALSDEGFGVLTEIDVQATLKKKLDVDFRPYTILGACNPELAKQALDAGLMGIVFNTVNTKEEAENAVRQMRYPPQQNDPNTQRGLFGFRGSGASWATWNWGVASAEYRRRADLWPLNPNGDLISILLIETPEGVRNIDEIASVPGVGVINAAAAGDLSNHMGIAGQGSTSAEVEEHRQTILRACLANDVVCGILARGKEQIDMRLKEGWKMLTTPSGTAER